jgi:thiol:disulfide interchange protein DsbD
VETYRKGLTITMPVEVNGPFTLLASGQGCSEKGLCYAPQDYKAAAGSGRCAGAAAAAAACGGRGARAARRRAQGARQPPAGRRQLGVDGGKRLPRRRQDLHRAQTNRHRHPGRAAAPPRAGSEAGRWKRR